MDRYQQSIAPIFRCQRHGPSFAPEYGGWGLQGPRCIKCGQDHQAKVIARAAALSDLIAGDADLIDGGK